MTKPTTTTTQDDGIPAFLKRETNKRGVTLSGGVTTERPAVVASGAKLGVEPKPPTKKERKAAEAQAKRDERAAKARAASVTEMAEDAIAKSTPVTPEPALDADGNPLVKVSRSIVPMRFKEKYKGHAGTCGDDMALELKAATTTRNADKREVLDVEALWAIAKVNEIDVSKYLDLNNGQKRMNVGNKLRGKLAAGENVVVGTRTFRAEDFAPNG